MGSGGAAPERYGDDAMTVTPSGRQPRADALVLFGATGDLAKRKLFPALYHMEDRGELDLPIVGVARSDWTDDIFRKEATSAIEAAVPKIKKTVLKRLQRRLDLVQGDYADPTTWAALTDVLDKHRSRTRRVLHGDPAVDVPHRRRVAGVGGAQRTRPDRRREAVRA